MQSEAIAAARSAGFASGQRCAVRLAALDGELPPSSPGALFWAEVGSGFRVVRTIQRGAAANLHSIARDSSRGHAAEKMYGRAFMERARVPKEPDPFRGSRSVTSSAGVGC